MDPKGRVALISGGARIGQEVAAALARRGCHIALTYNRSRKSAEETADRVRSFGARSMVVKADLSRAAGAAAAVHAVHGTLGGPDILLCMAAVYGRVPWGTLAERTFRMDVGVALASAVRLAR